MAAGRPVEAAEEISQLRETMPRRESMVLIEMNRSVRQTIMREAIEQCEAEVGEEVDQYWLPEKQCIVIDLSGGADE